MRHHVRKSPDPARRLPAETRADILARGALSRRPRRARGWSPRMMLRVSVQEPPDHALILRVVPARFGLEEIHTAFAQGDGDLDPLVPEDKILGSGKKVRNDPWVSESSVRVSDFPAHISACLSASSRRQKSE